MEKDVYEFCDYLKRRGLHRSTIDDYTRTLKRFFAFVREHWPEAGEITEITREVVRAFEKYLMVMTDARGKLVSVPMRKKRLTHLKLFFRYLEREERVYTNPAANIAYPKERRTLIKDVLTVEEMESLLKGCSGHSVLSLRDRAILELLYSTGIRADELCNIETADVNLEEGLLFVRKGKNDKERLIPFGESAAGWLQRYLEKARPLMQAREPALLFVTLRGKRFIPRVLCQLVKKWAATAGIEKNVTTHTFRHSCATHMLKGGADIRYVQRQLGHRCVATTERYLKIEITDLKEIHERCHPREQDDW